MNGNNLTSRCCRTVFSPLSGFKIAAKLSVSCIKINRESDSKMLVPSHFREENQEKLQQFITEYSFGVLVVADSQGIDANHVPFHFSASEEHPLGMLRCHVARVNPVWLKVHLHQLTDLHESGRETPWSVDDAPSEFTSRLVQAIVGIEIRIESLTGQVKASQNHPERNRTGVKAGLAGGTASESAMSEFVS